MLESCVHGDEWAFWRLGLPKEPVPCAIETPRIIEHAPVVEADRHARPTEDRCHAIVRSPRVILHRHGLPPPSGSLQPVPGQIPMRRRRRAPRGWMQVTTQTRRAA